MRRLLHAKGAEHMARSAVVILENGRVALIQRVRAGQTYYVL